ncbi:MAG: hypothetical protein KKI08_18750, partial [Armatimonadetes bacterium]|nr:hypothetical protein [Armatimonadota bacterium]
MEIPRWYRYGALSAVALLLLLGGLDALRTRPTPPDGTDARETPKPKARRPAPSLASGLETWTENLPRLPQAPLPSAPSGSQGPRLPSSLPFREFSSDKAQPYLDVTNDTYESLYM